jgi:hypothetical protein
MDILALQKAMKAKKTIKALQDRLGAGVQDIYPNVKTRLEQLESKDPHVTLYNRVSDVEATTAANLNKHNLRMNAVVNKNRYGMTDLAFDDFYDDTGIDATKSTGHLFDPTSKTVKINSGATQAEVVTTAEPTDVVPSMIVVSQTAKIKDTDSKSVDLTAGVMTNTEFANGKIQLKVTSPQGATPTTYSPSGSYESPVLDLGDNYKSFVNLNQIINVPTGTSLVFSTSTSTDGVNFSAYQSVNSDGTIASPAGRYIKVKVDLTGGVTTQNRTLNDFATSESSQFQGDSQIVFDGSLHLKTSYSDPMAVDTSFTDTGILLRKTIDKSSYKTIEKVSVS